MNYFIKHFSYTLVLVASLLISSVSFSEEAKPQFVKDYESGYGKYFQVRSEAREKISLRSIASDDPNAPIKKDEAMEGFKKYLVLQKEKQKRRENFDLDKDGKTDCKRRFYPNSSQIKTEVCDFNHDGVVDLKTKYNKDGLAVLELTNFDKDKFFEKKVSCKTITPDKEVARCVTETALDGSNTRTLMATNYLSDFNQAIKNRRRKRAGRTVASTNGGKDRFDDSKLPHFGEGLGRYYHDIKIHEANGQRVKADKVREKMSYIRDMTKKGWKIKDINGMERDISYMKYFSSFRAYFPGDFDSCLHASRDCCQSGVDYSKLNAEGDMSDYQHCMHYSLYWCVDNGRNLPENVNWCNADQEKVEGEIAPCFECMIKDLYSEMGTTLEPHYESIYRELDNETPPEGFYAPEADQVWFHESCRPFFKEREPYIEVGEACYTDSKGNTSVQANVNRMRVARYMEPNHYSYFSKLKNTELGEKVFNEKKFLDFWKSKKETLDKICEGVDNCDQYLHEDSPKIKVFCAQLKTGSEDSTSNTDGVPASLFSNLPQLFSPPYIVLNLDKDRFTNTSKDLIDDIENKGLMAHAIYHTMGHSHLATKKLSNGKVRCGWSIEPDYTALCDPQFCTKEREDSAIWCGMKPGSHLTEDGDLSKNYMDTVFKLYYERRGYTKESVFGLVDDPKECSFN
ncbi:MAG: hypothetical protein VX642_03785 [Bdellovibrionota bacterium]|nr:hypothetical protein [Bdellovibrionota bacterium]